VWESRVLCEMTRIGRVEASIDLGVKGVHGNGVVPGDGFRLDLERKRGLTSKRHESSRWCGDHRRWLKTGDTKGGTEGS